MGNINIILTILGLVVALITLVFVIIGWSYQDMKINNILKDNLRYEINDNIRKIDIFLEIFDSNIKTTGRLEAKYLVEYRGVSKDKNIRDKLAKIISDIQTYNDGMDLIDNGKVDENYSMTTQKSNAELIKSNLEFIGNIV
jgi:hypothetical protein